MDAARLRRKAKWQAGLFTRAQALECGFSAKQIRHRLATGAWQPVLGPVIGEAGVCPSRDVLDRAAVLAVPNSALAGPAAARLWGMPAPDSPPCLAIPSSRHVRMPGVRLLRADIDRRDIGVVDGIRATWRERTVFDCLLLLPEPDAVRFLDRALQRNWITFEELTDRVHRHAGRRGARRVVRMIRQASPGARSFAERTAVVLLSGAKIVGWRLNVPIVDSAGVIGVGDIVFERARLVVEIDGWAFHVTPDRFHRDRERQNRLVAAGWTVLRFTWRDLTERPAYVITTIKAMLARVG